MALAEFDLTDRLGSTEGTVALNGVEAVVRVPLDQRRADQRNGLRTAGLISGYRGSPLGGMDSAYERNRALLEANDIRFISGVNEDLGATAVWGSQLSSLERNQRFDGVLGMWYGKGPGLDRSGDAIRHANTSGVSPRGGVLAAVGDDPSNKSSSIPSASEWALADLAMPTLYPGSVQEVLDFGRVGYELSRFCGSWIGFKIETNVADGYATVELQPDRISIVPVTYEVDGSPWRATQEDRLIGAFALHCEEEMFSHRLRAAELFVAEHGLDHTIGSRSDAKLGIVAAGAMYYEVVETLRRLGIELSELSELGIRLYKPAMIWPIEPTGVRSFADGLEEIVVVESKRSFVENQVRDLLYGRSNAPRVLGKVDDEGRPLIKIGGAVVSDDLVAPLRQRLERFLPDDRLRKERPRIALTVSTSSDEALPTRPAHFCSGCPHNRSTKVPEGSVAGGGIGCHGLAMNMDRDTVGLTHMGAEGAQWVGIEPFVSDKHRFQNIGDGTLAHSGSLAIRQAVSAASNVTYKILYNGTVAMTGGQDAAGQLAVPELTRWLEAEGVVRTIVVSAEPDSYGRDAVFAKSSRIVDRERLDDAQVELRDVPGVTALIYDQACAAELRRGRKRGTIETPTTRVMIDSALCEGCGDCGVVSNCASVHPVITPFGRKTQIHQESCNFDLTCLDGNCPAFVTVEIDPDYRPKRGGTIAIPEGELPAEPLVPEKASLVLVGIGGTGVVTMSQVISTAALLDGKKTNSLDQTGIAQKGGTVVSNLRIHSGDDEGSNFVGSGEADALLLFDLVSGTSQETLKRATPGKTVAIVSTGLVPTGPMVSGRGAESFPELQRFAELVDPVTNPEANMWLDAAGIAQSVFASQPLANALVVGVAFQRGLLPVTSASIEKAIELNGASVAANLEAFRLGRRIAADPTLLDHLTEDPQQDQRPPALSGEQAELAASVLGSDADQALADILAWRLPELVEYENLAYAKRFADVMATVRNAERHAGVDGSELTQTAARQFFKLLAYKDEYEVARLALKSDLPDQARKRFGPNAKVSYRLQPPTLKAAGYKKKISIPEAAGRKMFQGLRSTKRLRGTKFDPFGRTVERRLERTLIDEYEQLLLRLAGGLTAENHTAAVRIAALADQIRGYDSVKLANVERYRLALADALADWSASVK